MNLNCVICSDILTPSAEIFSTACGHLFHYTCLLQWLQQSRTCPQCRCKSTEKTIHRIYFNVLNHNEKEDPALLQNKLDNAQFQLKLKEGDLKNIHEKHDKAIAQNLGLRQEMKTMEDQIRSHTTVVNSMKDKITLLKSRVKDKDKLQDEVLRLQRKLTEMDNKHLVIHGSKQEVDNMLKQNKDPEFLVVLVSSLKQELTDSLKRKKQIRKQLSEAEREVASYKKAALQLETENCRLQMDLNKHKTCDREKKLLKGKIASLESNSSCIIVDESPVSTSKFIQDDASNCSSSSETQFSSSVMEIISPKKSKQTPSVQERIEKIKESESPYLTLKSNSASLLQTRRRSPQLNKYSIFKQPVVQGKSAVAPKSTGVIYDGLGGHGKDESFPSPSLVKGVKRKHLSKTTSSAKFKKLAPIKSLDNFFSAS